MRYVVVDASVAVKWLLPSRPEEADVQKALMLLQAIDGENMLMMQPPHFLAEVMGVVTRLAPDYALQLFNVVKQVDMRLADSAEVYRTAINLSRDLNHHLFDTLYHAAALETPKALLITADAVYYRKANGIGGITAVSYQVDYSNNGRSVGRNKPV
ncbi:MAG: type II toxin-antitoxin system VapC family toxin [Methylovulum sp.]|nr:type II toxin-antitoxin system VapC family toxin [Methylovulum sp.]